MGEGRMPKKTKTKAKTKPKELARPTGRPRPLKVGDRVRFVLGTQEVVADVVEDRGGIGVGGRQLVGIALRTYEGEVEKFEMAAEEVTLEAPSLARRRRM
jgi:hypothetical protein